MRSQFFYRNRKKRRDRVLRKMANMRAKKDAKRLADIAAGWTPEPKMERWYPLEFGVRDKVTGEFCWVDFKSVRDAARRLGAVRKFYAPGIRSGARFVITNDQTKNYENKTE